jgi:serine/threonine protein kinase
MDDQTTDEFIRIQAALAGRYSLQRELGRGGMGIVYLAHDVALERPVALKVLRPELVSRPAVRQRFLDEARTAAKLSHPNITPIFAAAEADGFVFFVMAYVEGETLGERIRSRGPIPPAELAKILRQVGWALAYAHAQGVVHRDVKADNIMIERTSGRALVVDFGIAGVLQDTDVTGVGEVLGTPDYMSPEQASGGATGPEVDWWLRRRPRLKPRLGHLSLKHSQFAERRLQPSFFFGLQPSSLPTSRVQWLGELVRGRGSGESDERRWTSDE